MGDNKQPVDPAQPQQARSNRNLTQTPGARRLCASAGGAGAQSPPASGPLPSRQAHAHPTGLDLTT